MGMNTLSEVTNLDFDTKSDIEKLSKQGNYKEAVELYGKKMRQMGRGGFKEGIKPWQKDFFEPLMRQSPPTLSSTSHIKEGTPAQIGKFNQARKIYTERVARIKQGLAEKIGDQDVDSISAEVIDKYVRELSMTFSEKAIETILKEDEANARKANKVDFKYSADGFLPDLNTRKKNWQNGEFYVSLDANQASNVDITQPLVVLPKDAPNELKEAAAIYAEGMLKLHKEELGRNDFKSQVVTSGEPMSNGKPWRGKEHVTHLEGFAITDTEMLAFLKTPRGKAAYRQVLNNAFGNVHGVTLGLPHNANDGGAKNSTGDDEVSLARYILGDTQPEGSGQSQTTQDPSTYTPIRTGY